VKELSTDDGEGEKERLDPEVEYRIKESLRLIDPNPYADWITIGMILHGAYKGSDEGVEVWMDWARGSAKFDKEEHIYKWRSFGKSKGAKRGLGTLFDMAKSALYSHVEVRHEVIEESNKTITLRDPVRRRPRGWLAMDANNHLFVAFNSRYNHQPSVAMWQALYDLHEKLEQMADGELEPLPNLYSLDPGVGKTQAVVQFVRRLLASEEHRDVAVLICVSRLEEIRTLIQDMGLGEEQRGVRTADDEYNKLGVLDTNIARVLFTTQQTASLDRSGFGMRQCSPLRS
jgi:hypothetical protein